MRTFSGMTMTAVLAIAAGCGKPESTDNAKGSPTTATSAKSADPALTSQAASNIPEAKSNGNTISVPTVSAAWELDPARHVIPESPAAGHLFGKSVMPDAQIEEDALRFRVMVDGNPTGELVEIHLIEPGKSFEGLKLSVKPDQEEGARPVFVIVQNPKASPAEPLEKGFALTLEVGKREKGKFPGKVFLSLPGDAKPFLAGTFNADWLRSRSEPATIEVAPFIRGTIQVKGGPDPYLVVGYVRDEPNAKGNAIIDSIGGGLKPGTLFVRSDKTRSVLFPMTDKEPARYEFTHLEPGRYFVFATFPTGPAVWRWVNVAADGQVVADFALDQAAFGSLEVTAPSGAESVSVLPESEGKPWNEMLAADAARQLQLHVPLAKETANPQAVKFPHVAPGKYRVWAGGQTATVEVKANETAKVEIKK